MVVSYFSELVAGLVEVENIVNSAKAFVMAGA